jgi:hypothetical protein
MLGARTIALTALCLTTPLAAQDSAATLRGRVIDARTMTAVGGAAVTVTSGRDTVARGTADADGYYQAPLSVTSRLVAHFRRVGYRADSLALDAAPSGRVDVAMTPLGGAVALAATRITAARSRMEERARRAGGTFIGAEEIARKGPSRTSDLLRGVRGVVVRDEDGVMRVASTRIVNLRAVAATRRLPQAGADSTGDALQGVDPPGTANRCLLRVGLDGKMMPEEFTLDEVSVAEVTAVEVYRGASTIPVEFSNARGDVKCGLVMLWTRMGEPTRVRKRAP